jgi:hypothetical protein
MPISPYSFLPSIDDSNYRQHIPPPVVNGQRQAKGYFGMWARGAVPPKTFADLGLPLLTKAQVYERALEQAELKSNLYHYSLESGLPCLNQGSTNYCWINGPVHCMEIERLKETGQVVSLSPASAGARIKNFRNVGGWGSEGLEWMIQHGVNETSDWPANAIDRRYLTDVNIEKAKQNVIVEYFVLSTWEEVLSCIIANIPVAVGYNWWLHEVTGTFIDPVSPTVLDLGIRNSWGMQWGDKGFSILRGSQKYPDDAVAIVSMIAA